MAPLGYKNTKNDKGDSVVIPDPNNAHLVRMIFELYASGESSMETIAKIVSAKGLTG